MSDYPKIPCSLEVYAFLIVASVAFIGTALRSSHWLEIHTISVGLFSDNTGLDLDFDRYKYLCITAIVCYALTMVTIGHLVCVRRMLVSSTTHGWITLVLALIGAGATAYTVGHFRWEAGVELIRSDFVDTWNYGYCLYLAAASVATSVVAGMSALIATRGLANSWLEENTEIVIVHVPDTEMEAPTHNVLYTVETTTTTILNTVSELDSDFIEEWGGVIQPSIIDEM